MTPPGVLRKKIDTGKKSVEPFRVIENICFGFDPGSPSPAWLAQTNRHRSLSEALESVLKRYIRDADGDIGLFLSGGIDSSFIGALLVKLMGPNFQTFTFAFNAPSVSDSDVLSARFMSKKWGVKNHRIDMDMRTVAESFNDPRFSGMADGQINTFQMALYAAGVKGRMPVSCLTGIGADELMGSSFWIRKFYRVLSLPMPDRGRRLLAVGCRKLKKYRYEKYFNPPLLALSLRSLFPPVLLQELSEKADREKIMDRWLRFWYGLHASDDLERFQRLLFRLDLYEIQMSAYRCLGERIRSAVRHPYLDSELMGYWNRFPVSSRWRSGNRKEILRQDAGRVLPGEIIRRPKVGLTWPWDEMLFNGLNAGVAEAIFDSPRLFSDIGFNKEKLHTLWEAYKSRKPSPIGFLGWVRLALKSLVL